MNPVNHSSPKYCAYQESNKPAPVNKQFVPFVVSGVPCPSTNDQNIYERKVTNPDGFSKCDQPSKKRKHITDEIKTGLAPLYEGFSPETIRSIYSGEFRYWKVSEGKEIFDILRDPDDKKKKFVYKEISEYLKNFPKELFSDAACLIAFDHFGYLMTLFAESKIAKEKLIEIFSSKMMTTTCDLNPVIDSGGEKLLPPDTPINLIWVGSLLPDRYLENIPCLASISNKVETLLPAKREIILWKDRTLLTEAEDSLMKRIPELPEMRGINIKVLDINDAGLKKIFEGSDLENQYQSAFEWVRDEHKNYAMYSDVVRFALLAAGAGAIDQAEGDVTERTGKGMIYMDTDTLDTDKFKDAQKKGKKCFFSDLGIELGFASAKKINRSDFLACNEVRHPIALITLRNLIKNLNDISNQKHLASLKEQKIPKDYLDAVVDISGPVLFNNSRISLFLPDGDTKIGSNLQEAKYNSTIHSMADNLNISVEDDDTGSLIRWSSDCTWFDTKPASFYEANWKKQLSSQAEQVK
ncbi:hypothetical protein [Endozoicomonas euniceicola]|uniref:Uncharacterized protein n=1 Tax=Endozoicomonas euniceicola TaxID=1234143 RepID=A0ABY6GXC2_9GAMM|nr:hypothetical protein [Endozoicomonas euniceicola]UYM17433.1 hypothetical protein NX720_05800 [Endozoicomonas euniceicola]